MEPHVNYDGSRLSVHWTALTGVSNYTLFVDQCDETFTRCVNRFKAEQTSPGLSAATGDCWPQINVRLEARSSSGRILGAENEPVNTNCDAMDTLEVVLIAVLAVICLVCVILCALIAYHRRNPVQRIQRVRSKMYSRLYSKDRYERPILKTDFLTKADDLLADGDEEQNSQYALLREEFAELERLSCDTIHHRTSASTQPVNRRRNRYHDIVPFDYNRVKLNPPVKLDDDQDHSDFINASNIPASISSSSTSTAPSSLRQQTYIAAQGPSDETTPLFWETVWQRNVRVIVMLTNVVEGFGFNAVKCSQYWPSQVGQSLKVSPDLAGSTGSRGSSSKRHHVQVQLFDVQESPDYTVRKLDLSDRDSGDSREVVHLQFTAWPDRSAPADPGALLQLLSVTTALSERYLVGAERAPWLVHCSAGVGRTGTFIAVNQLLQLADDRNVTHLDVFHHVYNLRQCRSYMVQSGAQYVYIYKCLREYLKRKQEEEDNH